MDRIACLLDDNVDAHRPVQGDAVVVDEALGLAASIRPLGDGSADLCLRKLEQAGATGQHLVLAVLGDELPDAPLAEPIGTELPADVTEHKLGRTAVGSD